MIYVPKIATGIKKGQDFQTIKKATQTLLKELNLAKSTQQALLGQIDMEEKGSLKSVQDLRKILIKHIDDLTEAESDKIRKKYQVVKDNIQKSITAVEGQIKVSEASNKRLNEFKGDNESQLFVYIKQGEKVEKDGKVAIQTLNKPDVKNHPKFKINYQIEKSLRNVKSLGEFEDSGSVLVNRQPRLKGEYNVKVRGDSSVCDVVDSCLLPDGTLILTDWTNKSLKHLDTSYNVKGHLSLSSGPCCVCSTGLNEVALTLTIAKKVQFVIVEDTTMSTTRSFSVGEICRGICCSKDELFICCGSVKDTISGHVRVYNLSGTLLRTILSTSTGQPMFSVTYRITASSSGNKLHVTDTDKGVITIDRTGNIMSTYNDTDLKCPRGICTLDNDDLLVCGYSSNNIHHISSDGRKLAVVLKEQDGIKHLRSVCYDVVNSRIIVNFNDTDNIKVYELV